MCCLAHYFLRFGYRRADRQAANIACCDNHAFSARANLPAAAFGIRGYPCGAGAVADIATGNSSGAAFFHSAISGAVGAVFVV